MCGSQKVQKTKKTFTKALSIFLLFLAFLSACSSDSIYEQNVDLDDRLWLADSAIKFTFKIPDPSGQYDIYYNFRNTITYPFHNLYVTYTLQDTAGNVLLTDLHNMDLFDPKTGKPYGKGLGDIFSHQFKAISDYKFPDSGTYQMQIQQFMRRDTLPEILSVGISIKPSETQEE